MIHNAILCQKLFFWIDLCAASSFFAFCKWSTSTINLVYIRCISSMNLSKLLLNYCIHFFYSQNAISPNNGIWRFVNTPFAFSLLPNIYFCYWTQKNLTNINFPWIIFETFTFLLSVFSLRLPQFENIFL